MSLTIIDVGALTLIQDLGRPGLAASGVTESGAADRRSMHLANLLLANPEGAPVLETVLVGLTLRAEDDVVLAAAGAPAPLLVDGDAVPGPVLQLRAGQTLRVGMPEWGMRTYLAVPGGVRAEPVLGSASTDTLAGLGSAPLEAGDTIEYGAGSAEHNLTTIDAADAGWAAEPFMLDLLPGPRADWFTASALARLFAATFTVTDEGDRVGVRLQGERLERVRSDELPSEGIVRGAVQVPPNGQPLLFGPDHPVTGGYPVIGVLTADAADAAAQLRPGRQIRFRRRGAWE